MNFSVVYNNRTTSSLFFPFLLLCTESGNANSLSKRRHLYFFFVCLRYNLHAFYSFFFSSLHFIISVATCIFPFNLALPFLDQYSYHVPKRYFKKIVDASPSHNPFFLFPYFREKLDMNQPESSSSPCCPLTFPTIEKLIKQNVIVGVLT